MKMVIPDLDGEKNIPTHVVAVFGFIQKDDKYLIAKRSASDPQSGGEWSIPSGKVEIVEGKEVLEDALKREIKEEVGLEIEDEIVLIGNAAFTRVSGDNVIALTFLCKWKSGVAKPLEDQEDVQWMTLNQLKEYDQFPRWTADRVLLLEKYTSNKSYKLNT